MLVVKLFLLKFPAC
uniref:Uncharacterized protein n=1 Tax=Arundo donax TaxID=35708 RepID=A0A0A8Y4T7_ARUDO